MARCKACGNETEVLQKISLPFGKRFLGMCKPCIVKELGNMRSAAEGKVKEFLNRLFREFRH
jgi:hypothetical protein